MKVVWVKIGYDAVLGKRNNTDGLIWSELSTIIKPSSNNLVANKLAITEVLHCNQMNYVDHKNLKCEIISVGLI